MARAVDGSYGKGSARLPNDYRESAKFAVGPKVANRQRDSDTRIRCYFRRDLQDSCDFATFVCRRMQRQLSRSFFQDSSRGLLIGSSHVSSIFTSRCWEETWLVLYGLTTKGLGDASATFRRLGPPFFSGIIIPKKTSG